jgi:hypothetical protein
VQQSGRCLEPSLPGEPTYFVPVTSRGDRAVVGDAVRFVAIADVDGLEVEPLGAYVQLRWRWPYRCALAQVCWRDDAAPTSATDPKASTRPVSRADYERHGGARVERAGAGARFAVFAVAELDGVRHFSPGFHPGCRAEPRAARPPVAVAYDVSRGLIRRDTLTLTLRAAEDVADLPEIVVVGKPGETRPRNADDGVVLARLHSVALAAGAAHSVPVKLDGIRRPAYLRLVFRDPAAYDRFRLEDPEPARLRIR